MNYPLRLGKYKAAFIANNILYLAKGSITTQNNNRDASYTKSALSRNQGRPYY